MNKMIVGMALVSATWMGCGNEEPFDCLDEMASDLQGNYRTTDQALAAMNGRMFNGITLNGINLNGATMNGAMFNGVQVNGVSMNGLRMNGTTRQGTRFNGAAYNGSAQNGENAGICATGLELRGTEFALSTPEGEIKGTDFIGAELLGELSNGSFLRLRIDGMDALAEPNQDVFAYQVSFRHEGEWFPLCGTGDAGEPILAIPVHGVWDMSMGTPGAGGFIEDSGRFTFACRGFAIAKCVELGYKPWQTVEGRSLSDYHQACVRMVRADYCGDGRSWTEDGTLINLYDGLGIQSDTESWTVEAAWDISGARCINGENFRVHRPDCMEALASHACGADSLANGALFVTEIPR